MGKVIAQASMSLDGFIADTNDQVGPLFDWYCNGDVEVTCSDPFLVFHTSAASAAYLRAAWSTIGADVIGRRHRGFAGRGSGPALRSFGEVIPDVSVDGCARHRCGDLLRPVRPGIST